MITGEEKCDNMITNTLTEKKEEKHTTEHKRTDTQYRYQYYTAYVTPDLSLVSSSSNLLDFSAKSTILLIPMDSKMSLADI